MRFLVDQCLSPDFATVLATAGHDVVNVRDFGMERAPDAHILELARTQDRTLLSADTDFGTILAQSSAIRPSVVIFRRMTRRRPSEQAALLLANLPAVSAALDDGSAVVIEEGRIRVRTLPIVE
jgi:predicted nuclease of predicted toxin-antitoxin system